MTRSDSPPEEVNSLPYNLRSRHGRPASQTPQKGSQLHKPTAGQASLNKDSSPSQPESSKSAQAKGSSAISGLEQTASSLSDHRDSGAAADCSARHDAVAACATQDESVRGLSPSLEQEDSQDAPVIAGDMQLPDGPASPQQKHRTPSHDSNLATPERGRQEGSCPVQPLVPYLSPVSPAPSHDDVFSTPEVTDQDLMARVRDYQPSGPWQRLAASEEQAKQLQQDLDSAHATVAAHQKQLSAMLEQKKHDAAKHSAEVHLLARLLQISHTTDCIALNVTAAETHDLTLIPSVVNKHPLKASTVRG